ncbi:GntR family transcriptional regulator [Marinobacter shengliensis]|uniref:GntR family transcriptional regulator n=1 Tax=Marinobacter shengliensis TaxID=1389223 RepID=UPI00257434BF|nr:GntR family transcriptional regulator [Marinobacter shengliensis]BEH12991.1 GntR family transcriptional regulator [Marinobacter shengliensis]
MNKSTKKAAIYEYILEKLMTRQYRFGEKIVVKELSEETGVSRQPIMSALSNLQERGFVEITAQVGCTVYRPSSSEVDDFYRLFSTNEGLVAALAAERGQAQEVRRLAEINEKIHQINPAHTDADADYRRLNEAFHHCLHAMARSPLVSRQQMANFELSDFFIVQSCGFEAHLGQVTDEHEEIIAAIRAGDAAAAQARAMEHIDSIARQVVKALPEAEA